MAIEDFNPASIASAMQIQTRKQQNFDKVEAELPDPKAPGMQISSQLNFGDVVNKIGDLNPFGWPVAPGDTVWMFDNTAFKTGHMSSWQAEYVAAVFEKDAKCKVVDVVQGVARAVGLADDAEEIKTIEERIMPFLWDIRVARTLKTVCQDKEFKLGPTSLNGMSTDVLKIPHGAKGTFVKSEARVAKGVNGILEMQTYYAGHKGWVIISGMYESSRRRSGWYINANNLIDVDDTIKITSTSDPIGILRETFVNPTRPVAGMPQLYAGIKANLPEDTPWFYLSASPYNLYPMLRKFRDEHFPPGTLLLRDQSWKTVSGLLSTLTTNTEEYKVNRMKKINGWLPDKKLILIGDSTQSDPEAYGEM